MSRDNDVQINIKCRALAEFYAADIQSQDFQTNPQAAMNNINEWVRNLTKGSYLFIKKNCSIISFHYQFIMFYCIRWIGKISHVLPKGIDQATKIAVVNGLAFRSQWLFRFDPGMTFDKGLFYTTSKKRFHCFCLSHGLLFSINLLNNDWLSKNQGHCRRNNHLHVKIELELPVSLINSTVLVGFIRWLGLNQQVGNMLAISLFLFFY